MVLNATFNNISVISWRSVSMVEESGGPGENHRPAASHWQTLSHERESTHNISGDRYRFHRGSCKSNYHRIRATTAPSNKAIDVNWHERPPNDTFSHKLKYRNRALIDVLHFICPLAYLLPKTYNYLAFQSFDYDRTWWRLFQKCTVSGKWTLENTEVAIKIGQSWETGNIGYTRRRK
jgi:hypothetical protein